MLLLDIINSKVYDLIVIGLGSGGLATVKRAAQLGVSVAAIEYRSFGGTCVNVGCVPKKVLWTAASLSHSKGLDARYGLFESLEAFSQKKNDITANQKNDLGWFEMAINKEARESYIKRIHSTYAATFKKLEYVDLYLGGSVTIERDGKKSTIEGQNIVIATGGRPSPPLYPYGITSDEFWDISKVPETAVVIGGGYIAAELASILKSLGSKRVVIVVRKKQLLTGFDRQIVEALQQDLEEGAGIEIFFQCQVADVKAKDGVGQEGGQIRIESMDRPNNITTISADLLIWAIGRDPNTNIEGIPDSIIDPETNLIKVNGTSFKTHVPGLYAIGDCTNNPHHLTPVAIAAGRALAEQLFGNEKKGLETIPVPTIIFTVPPVATIGDSEEEAIRKYGHGNIRVFVKQFTPMAIAAISAPKDRLRKRMATFKLVCLGDELKIIGMHLFGPSSEEIIQGFAVAMTTGNFTKAVLDSTIALHPTIAEELLGMQ